VNTDPPAFFLALPLAVAAAFALAGCASHHTAMGAGSAGSSSAATGSAPSAPTAGAPSAAAGPLAAMDREFATMAAGNGLYEVEVSRLAQSRATDPQVRNFAQMLVQHHTQANSELMTLLRGKGFTPPTAMPPDKQAKIQRLSQLSGAEFDRQYIQVTGIQDHQADVALFERASREAADPQLKGWAAKTLLVLRQHLQAAQGIAGRMAG
jgi:putative membrane protein